MMTMMMMIIPRWIHSKHSDCCNHNWSDVKNTATAMVSGDIKYGDKSDGMTGLSLKVRETLYSMIYPLLM